MHRFCGVLLVFLPALGLAGAEGRADTVGVGDLPVYVTRQDCQRLVAHHPDPSVAYQSGVDVNGRPVTPADLPGSQFNLALPDKITFDLKVNPLAYGAQQPTATTGRFANSAAAIAHIEMDPLNGALKINGHALQDDQTRLVTEACRKAGKS